jgi:hypothetical protein
MIMYNIAGDAELRQAFERLPRTVRDRLYAAMDRVRRRLEEAVKAAEPRRTGALLGSTTSFISRSGDRIDIGVEVEGDRGKASALEYGSHKTITVRKHAAAGRLTKRMQRRALQMSEAYQRRTNIMARHFLGRPFDRMQDQVMAELEAGVSEAIVEDELDAAADVAGIQAALAAAAPLGRF